MKDEKLNDVVLENVSGGISKEKALAEALKHAGLSRDQIEEWKRIGSTAGKSMRSSSIRATWSMSTKWTPKTAES